MSLLETMSFGMVPVVTSVGSIPTVVSDNVNGLYVRVRNTDDIVSTIHHLCTDKVLLNRLSSEAQNTIVSLFDDEAYIAKLNSLYSN